LNSAITERTPHELLPIIPPSVQWSCVEGSGPNVRPCASASRRRSSRIVPGSTRASFLSGSISSTRFRYFEKSIITATLQHCPARLVPPPREMTGASYSRQRRTVSSTSSTVRGRTTPIGSMR
jgi:hypothetical protein